MSNAPSNTDDVIDSRDVIARIEELTEERAALAEQCEEMREAEDTDGTERAEMALQDWDNENGAELAALQSLANEAADYSPDWSYGSALIRDSYFKDYAQEIAEEIGAIDPNAQWPISCIDWDQAARELQMDYTSVEFDGVTYWIR